VLLWVPTCCLFDEMSRRAMLHRNRSCYCFYLMGAYLLPMLGFWNLGKTSTLVLGTCVFILFMLVLSTFVNNYNIAGRWVIIFKWHYGCVCVINIITLFFVWNIYLSVWTMDHVLFGVRLKFTRGVSTCTLLVINKLTLVHPVCEWN